MNVYIVEEQLTDHPSYKVFVGVFRTKSEAISLVENKLNEIIDDLEEDEDIIASKINEDQLLMEVEDSQVYIITRKEI